MIAPDAYLVLAEKLLLGVTEEEWRSAVSRAYYAAFHSARDFMLALGFQVPQGEQAHRYLWKRLANSGHPPLDEAGEDTPLSFMRHPYFFIGNAPLGSFCRTSRLTRRAAAAAFRASVKVMTRPKPGYRVGPA